MLIVRDALAKRQLLGNTADTSPSDIRPALVQLATVSTDEAYKDLDEVLQRLSRRVRTHAGLRFGSGAITTLSTAGLIALLLGTNRAAQLTTAVIGFLSSALTLLSPYFEDYSGGDGSTRRLRDSMSNQAKALTEVHGRFRIAQASGSQDELLGILQLINGVLAEVQFARAQLGTSI
jgi:hypothetical protein